MRGRGPNGMAADDQAIGAAAEDLVEARDAAGCEANQAAALPSPISAAIRQRGGGQDELIEVLHAIQPLQGYLSRAALHQVARELGLPLSQVYGVASFYHLFSRQPPAAHRLAVCRGTACFVNGAPRLQALLAARLGLVGVGGSGGAGGRAGDWDLVASGCQGSCGSQPVLRLDDGPAVAVPLEPPEACRAQLERLGVPVLAVTREG